MKIRISFLFSSLLCFHLASCSTSFEVQSSGFPSPMVETIPVSAELEFSDEFSSYTFSETRNQRRKISIALGDAQKQLFNSVVATLFAQKEDDRPSITLKPEVEAFQYAFPRETRAEIYEIWIKYRIQVLDQDNTQLADWVVTGYGKTPTAMLKSRSEAIAAATDQALRDVGAQIAIGFRRQPDIERWLKTQPGDVQ